MMEAPEELVIPYPIDDAGDARATAARFMEALLDYGWRGFFNKDLDAFVFRRPRRGGDD